MKEKIAHVLKELLPVNDNNYEYVAEKIANALSSDVEIGKSAIGGDAVIPGISSTGFSNDISS